MNLKNNHGNYVPERSQQIALETIGRCLRTTYAAEALPDRFVELLQQLERRS